MSEFLIRNAEIVVDETKKYLNASILIEDARIKDVYYDDRKDYKGKIIDLKGMSIIPAFFSLNEKGNIQKGVSEYLRADEELDISDRCLGYFKDYVKSGINEKLDVKLALVNEYVNYKALRYKGTKFVFGHSSVDYNRILEIAPDAIGPLYYDMDSFNPYRPSLISYAYNNDPYVLIDIKDLPKVTLDITLKNIRKDRLILIGNHMLADLKINLDLNDLVAFTSINAYNLLGYGKNKGRLLRGNFADFIILDKDRNYMMSVIRGELCR